MGDTDPPTGFIKIIDDLKSASGGYGGASLRLSGTGIPMTLLEEEEAERSTPPKRRRTAEPEEPPPGPWEWRRLKGEAVSLRARLSQREASVEQLHGIRRQMEEAFDAEKKILENRAELDKQTIKRLEVRIEAARRATQEAKEARAEADRRSSETRFKFEAEMAALSEENRRLTERLRATTTTVTRGETRAGCPNCHGKVKTDDETEESERERESESERKASTIAELEMKLRESRERERDAEVRSVELQNARITISNLEAERAQWEESKRLAARAARASDLEREVNAARETIALMRESIRGKLLLEEEMCNMRRRMEHMDRLEEQLASLEAERSETLRKLGRFERLGFGGDASALGRELDRLRRAEAVLLAEEGQLRSRLDSSRRENALLREEREEASRIAAEMTSSNERLDRLVSRLRKKMILVGRERDSYRQQLDLYEKEITSVVDNGGNSGSSVSSGSSGSSATTERIAALERALEGYRELVSKLEAELGAKETPAAGRDECRRLRDELDRLRGELEHRALKGDFNRDATKILHFSMNPAAVAGKVAEEKQAALVREVRELRARLEAGGGGSGGGGDGASSLGLSSIHAQEIEEFKRTHEIKINRLKEAFKLSSQEYRQACYQLFGWRVDRTKEGEYKLFSQYAESPDHYLFFHVGPEGVDLLETSFSASLASLIERYLRIQHSVPMFLNAVQSDLFSQQTLTNIL